MPFTREQFFDLFVVYNAQAAPVIAGLWLVSGARVLDWRTRLGDPRPR
jgi:hypothetical protein